MLLKSSIYTLRDTKRVYKNHSLDTKRVYKNHYEGKGFTKTTLGIAYHTKTTKRSKKGLQKPLKAAKRVYKNH